MAITYESELTALVIADPYNDFLSEGGKLFSYAKEIIEGVDCVGHMRAVLAAARAAGVRVFFAPHHCWKQNSYSSWQYIAPTQRQADRAKFFSSLLIVLGCNPWTANSPALARDAIDVATETASLKLLARP